MLSIKNAKTTIAVATAAASALFGAAVAQSYGNSTKGEPESVIQISTSNGPVLDEVTVPVGKSIVLRADRPIVDVHIGDSELADVLPITDRSIYIIGRELGSTSVTLYGRNNRLLSVMDVQVSYDLFNLKKRLYDVMPDEKIEVRQSGDSILLSGRVTSSDVSTKAATLANNYAPDKVVNLMTINQSQQVMLEVRFAEVERTISKELGLNTNVIFGNRSKRGGLLSNFDADNDLVNLESLAFAFGGFTTPGGNWSVDLLLDALEDKGLATILAEPNLVSISGEPAKFLAGGEFPVPVSSRREQNLDGDDQGIGLFVEFKEFGIRLAFTPTVIGDTINIIVEPEVSELDFENGITLNSIVIPALRTRRARTMVELRDGQSFAIAGLLSERFIDNVEQMPGIGNIPIIGALSRSAAYRKQNTELAIIVTPHLVEPSGPGELTVPTDHLVYPYELELFMLGMTEGDQGLGVYRPKKAAPGVARAAAKNSTGMDGDVGYIVE
ncbi:MAG: type II and III secretion system protein family protein [Marinicaulis sp.]|nr:type II and III secretion system protein family protein [Marinicaulis sp.]